MSKAGDVFKPALDYENGGVWVNGERKGKFRLIAGRLHPMKKHSDSKRYSALKLERFKTIADAVRKKGVVSYREFGDKLSEVKQEKSDLAMIWMVFTIPDVLSEYLVKEDVVKAREIMKKAARGALRRFLRKYLKKHENVPFGGDFKEGGVINVHIWSISFFNIYTSYNWFKEENYGKITHHLRYNSRKAVIDIQ